MQITDETKRVASEIVEYWELFNHHEQSSWIDPTIDWSSPSAGGAAVVEIKPETVGNKTFNVCDSTMCAAGTAVFLNTPARVFKDIVRNNWATGSYWTEEGSKLLGLNTDEANVLFYQSDNDEAKDLMGFLAAGDQEGFYTYANDVMESEL